MPEGLLAFRVRLSTIHRLLSPIIAAKFLRHRPTTRGLRSDRNERSIALNVARLALALRLPGVRLVAIDYSETWL